MVMKAIADHKKPNDVQNFKFMSESKSQFFVFYFSIIIQLFIFQLYLALLSKQDCPLIFFYNILLLSEGNKRN